MRKVTWKIAGAVAAVIAVLALGNTKQALAAGNATMLPDSAIKVDYQYEEIVIDAGENESIYYTDNPNAAAWEEVKVDADGTAVFDISWIKPGLTTRVYIKGDKDSLVTARYIEAQEKMSAEFVGDISSADVVDIDSWKEVYKKYPQFSSETGYILFFTKQGGAETAFFDVEKIEWKKGSEGNWRPFAKLDLGEMNAKGATLYFRIKAVNDADTKDGISGKRYSAEGKVFLQKLAVAPTVNVNNAAMSVGVRNGMEYSLDGKSWMLVPEYAKNATTNEVVVPVTDFSILPTTNRRVTTIAVPLVLDVAANIKIDASMVAANPNKYECEVNDAGEKTGIYVYVRTAASSRKSASKVAKILIPFAKATPDITKDITVTYQNTKSGASGIVITNNTSTLDPLNYQYAVVDDPDNLTGEELSDLTWYTVKASKSLKVSSSKAQTGKYLIFRVATESKNELPSAYVKYPYQLLYDKVSYAVLANTSLYPGGVMTATTSNNSISGEITYTWERCQTATGTYTTITSGTGYENSKYTIREADVGYYIRVKISNVSATGEKAEVISKNSGKIIKDPTK